MPKRFHDGSRHGWSGTTTVTVSAGVATFGNLSINKTGVGYTLTSIRLAPRARPC